MASLIIRYHSDFLNGLLIKEETKCLTLEVLRMH
jgi:hypothetical protein